jgi:tetratricopeptide (TPR) repeat protein
MSGSRHMFVLDSLALAPPLDELLAKAAGFEADGNWYLAGETYIALQQAQGAAHNPITKAKLLARAASCFEIARDNRTSARFYEEAAREVSSLNSHPQLAAELFNRAALQFRESAEFFFAGSAWVRAAEEFSKVQAQVINCSENLTPLPISALKSHLCGSCFEAAAEVYASATGNEMWSTGAYWRAGKAYSEGPPNIQAFDAYRRSLGANIKNYGTLKPEELRRSLPMSEEERSSKTNPIEVMEAALARCNDYHQLNPGITPQSMLQTHRQMAAAFHGFTLGFQAIANAKEAGMFRAAQNDRQRKIYLLERNYFVATLYWLWRGTSNYGESLGRWALSCLLVVITFAATYGAFGIVASAGNPTNEPLRAFDYFYFSVVTFSTLGYGDLHPVGFLGQAMACIEVFAGFIMFGVLLSFIGTRFQRS